MYFYLIGIDYKKATIDLREEFYRHRKAISCFWANRVPCGVAILVTCNRIEIYGIAGCADDACGHIAAFSRDFPDFSKYAYVKFGEAQVFRHMMRLACGLESQLNGEDQILTQLNMWKASNALPFPLEALWDKTISLSKRIRGTTGLGGGASNIVTLISGDITERIESKERHDIVIIGTGKIAELFARHRPLRAHLTFVAHRHYQKAQMLAGYSGGAALPLHDLPRVISLSDIVIGATSSPHYVLKKEHFDRYPVRRGYPLYIYDLAVPRDVDPAVGCIDGIYLYNLDNLEYLFCRYNKSIQDRIKLASGLIEDELGIYQEVIHGENY